MQTSNTLKASYKCGRLALLYQHCAEEAALDLSSTSQIYTN